MNVDHAAGTVSFCGGVSYGALAGVLAAEGVALHNLASLPHISVAGAVATATHGSGDANGNLATAVAGLELVTSSGELIRASRGDADFDGLVVGLGALGAVTRVTLDVEPAYEVRQRVFEGLGWEALYERFDELSASGYSVSVFTRWDDVVDQVWVKSARGRRAGAAARRAVRRAPPRRSNGTRSSASTRSTARRSWASRARGPSGCRTSAWASRPATARRSSRSTCSRAGTPPRRSARCARVSAAIRPVLQVSEIRTIAADRLWMSPQYGQDTIGIHFTWKPDQEAVERALVAVEAALAPFDARPHWGKLFLADAAVIAPLYERLPDFARLVERLDPRGAFRNDWLERRLLGR